MKLTLVQKTAATLAYADIFDYPLTLSEVHRWLISRKRESPRQLIPVLKSTANTRKVGGESFYFLPHRQKTVATRSQRQRWAIRKWQIAAKVGRWLKFVPTLKLVGVTGGLAMNNARRTDEIDLFLVTAPGALWLTRLFTTLLVELLGSRRHPGEQHLQDKICLNMFMAEDHLSLIKSERDLFAAHEILQMMPLWERGGVYGRFLLANHWVAKFLPNDYKFKSQISNLKSQNSEHRISNCLWLFRLLEPASRVLQIWYMRNRRTTEVVTANIIRFHPRDARIWVRQALARRLARFNIPLDKVFYSS